MIYKNIVLSLLITEIFMLHLKRQTPKPLPTLREPKSGQLS